MSPVHRHNDALVTGEAERPRNARVWDTHAQPPAQRELARPPRSEAPPYVEYSAPAADRLDPRPAPRRRPRAVSITRVLDELAGLKRSRRQPIPFGIAPDVWARLSPDTQQLFRSLARRVASVLR